MPKVNLREDAQLVERLYKPGDRLVCSKNRKTYQMGLRAGKTSPEFWMLCDQDGQKGKVAADAILTQFNRAENR